jgi:hypothetical protein
MMVRTKKHIGQVFDKIYFRPLKSVDGLRDYRIIFPFERKVMADDMFVKIILYVAIKDAFKEPSSGNVTAYDIQSLTVDERIKEAMVEDQTFPST